MIRYVLTAGEIDFMSARLGLSTPLSLAPTHQDAQAAYESLKEKRLITGSMDSISVDMVAALFIRTLGLSEQTWELDGGTAKALLFQKGYLVLVVAPDPYKQNGYLLEPAQERTGMMEAIATALELCSPYQNEIAARRMDKSFSNRDGAPNAQTYKLSEFAGLFYQTEGDHDGPTFT